MWNYNKTNGAHYFFATDLLAEKPQEAFDLNFWRSANRIIGSAAGRGTTWFVEGKKRPMALRLYKRGGIIGKFNDSRYLFLGIKRSRAYLELELLKYLKEAKVNVPTPIAAKIQVTGLSYQAMLLTEKIAQAQDLAHRLKTAPLSRQNCYAIGQMIQKMHQAGVNHTDLNIRNILLDDKDNVWLIDFDKCYQASGERWQQSNIDRLKRSFAKEKTKHPIHWDETHWQALLDGYCTR